MQYRARDMMERENQISEENSQSRTGNSDVFLLIALIAFIVFVAVAVLLIILDTRGQSYYADRMWPFFALKALMNLRF